MLGAPAIILGDGGAVMPFMVCLDLDKRKENREKKREENMDNNIFSFI